MRILPPDSKKILLFSLLFLFTSCTTNEPTSPSRTGEPAPQDLALSGVSASPMFDPSDGVAAPRGKALQMWFNVREKKNAILLIVPQKQIARRLVITRSGSMAGDSSIPDTLWGGTRKNKKIVCPRDTTTSLSMSRWHCALTALDALDTTWVWIPNQDPRDSSQTTAANHRFVIAAGYNSYQQTWSFPYCPECSSAGKPRQQIVQSAGRHQIGAFHTRTVIGFNLRLNREPNERSGVYLDFPLTWNPTQSGNWDKPDSVRLRVDTRKFSVCIPELSDTGKCVFETTDLFKPRTDSRAFLQFEVFRTRQWFGQTEVSLLPTTREVSNQISVFLVTPENGQLLPNLGGGGVAAFDSYTQKFVTAPAPSPPAWIGISEIVSGSRSGISPGGLVASYDGASWHRVRNSPLDAVALAKTPRGWELWDAKGCFFESTDGIEWHQKNLRSSGTFPFRQAGPRRVGCFGYSMTGLIPGQLLQARYNTTTTTWHLHTASSTIFQSDFSIDDGEPLPPHGSGHILQDGLVLQWSQAVPATYYATIRSNSPYFVNQFSPGGAFTAVVDMSTRKTLTTLDLAGKREIFSHSLSLGTRIWLEGQFPYQGGLSRGLQVAIRAEALPLWLLPELTSTGYRTAFVSGDTEYWRPAPKWIEDGFPAVSPTGLLWIRRSTGVIERIVAGGRVAERVTGPPISTNGNDPASDRGELRFVNGRMWAGNWTMIRTGASIWKKVTMPTPEMRLQPRYGVWSTASSQ